MFVMFESVKHIVEGLGGILLPLPQCEGEGEKQSYLETLENRELQQGV